MHYEDVLAQKHAERVPAKRGSVISCVAFAHRKQLNQKLVLPDNVKEILRCPRDEASPMKLELLCAAVRREIEGETVVYLKTERDIEMLAAAVERCKSKAFADEVDNGGPSEIPDGARLVVEVDEALPVETRRAKVAELVRSLAEGEPVRVRQRPIGTSREPPLDTFARALTKQPYKTFRELSGDRSMEEMRDRLLLCLWDALFLAASVTWSTDPSRVSNVTAADALELGYWFHRGQQNSKRPLFEGICAMCGSLLYGVPGGNAIGNICYGPFGRALSSFLLLASLLPQCCFLIWPRFQLYLRTSGQ